MPLQVAAAAMKKIGRLERLASSSAVSQVVYHATPASPTGWGLAPSCSGRGLPWAERSAVVRLKVAIENKISFTEGETPESPSSCKPKC